MTPSETAKEEEHGPQGSAGDACEASVGDRLLDLFVFAPAGLALTLAEELPRFVDKGRTRIEGQTATARMVGQFVVQMGRQEIERRTRQMLSSQPPKTAPATPAPRAPRPSPRPAGASTDATRPARRADGVAAHRVDGAGLAGKASMDVATSGNGVSPPTTSPGNAASVSARPSSDLGPETPVDDLAIPGYDTLSASQVVKRLAGLSHDELLEVGQHERTNRHRATILNRVEQLLSGETASEITTPVEDLTSQLERNRDI